MILAAIAFIAGFVVGILVGRTNAKKVEAAVAKGKEGFNSVKKKIDENN